MLEGTIDRGVKFLLLTQYGKVKHVSQLYYLKAFYLDSMRVKHQIKHSASIESLWGRANAELIKSYRWLSVRD